jgi:hypothetical protein
MASDFPSSLFPGGAPHALHPATINAMLRMGQRDQKDYTPTDSEEQGLKDQGLLGTAMGGLQAIGNTLDTPGAWVRGKIHGLLTDDWSKGPTGITDSTDRVYGSDLLTDITGWKAPDDHEWSSLPERMAHGALGFGLDVVTDPLSLLGIGGKTAQGLTKIADAGRLAKEASTAAKADSLGEALASATAKDSAGEWAHSLASAASTPGTIGSEIRAGDRAALNFHLPFWTGLDQNPALRLSLGTGNSLLGNAAATVADKLAYGTLSPLRLARGLLDPRLHGAFDAEAQKQMDQLYARVTREVGNAKEVSSIFNSAHDDIRDRVQALVNHHVDSADPGFADELLRGIQTDSKLQDAALLPKHIEEQIRAANGFKGGDPSAAIRGITDSMIDFHQNLKGLQDWAYKVWGDAGGHAPELEDLFAAHAYRSSSLDRGATAYSANSKRFGYKKGEFDAEPWIARNEATRHHPGSEPAINAKAKDPLLMGYDVSGAEPRAMTPSELKAAYEGALDAIYKARGGQGFPSGTNVSTETLRRLYSFEKHDKPNIATAFRSQWDDSIAPWANHADPNLPQAWRQTARDQATRKIIKNQATGDWDPWVRHINDGTDKELATDYTDELKRWDPLNNPVNLALGDKQPIDKVLHFLDGFKDVQGMLSNGVYDQNIARDSANYVGSLLDRASTLRQGQSWLSGKGIVQPAGQIKNGVPLADAWDVSGLAEGGLKAFVKRNYGQEVGQSLQAAYQQAQQAGGNIDMKKLLDGAIQEVADGLHVQPAAVKGMKAFADMAEASKVGNKPGPLLSKLDQFNTLWKTLQYNIWPPSHIRDIASRVTNSALDGRASILDILDGTRQGVDYLWSSGQNVSPRMREFIDSKIYKPYMAADINSGLAGVGKNNPSSAWYNLLAIPGMPGRGKEALEAGASVHPLVNLGYSTQHWGDFAGQFGHFDALRKANYTVEQARQIIKETHYTSELSPFEKSFLSRVVPFERFTVRNIPHQLAAVFSEPGGRTAQMVRGLTESSAEADKDTYVPEWMRENTVYPWGKNAEGEQGYYRNTLAPQHELNDIVTGHGLLGNIGRTAEKFAAKASPLALAIPELLADRQLETGRKISDLEKPIERATGIPYLDTIAHYSPFARLASEGERLPFVTDHGTVPQFLTNMLGLGKVGYYDSDRWKALDMRQALEQEAQAHGARPWTNYAVPGAPTAQRPYAKPGSVAAGMTPQELADVHALLQRRQGLTDWLLGHAQQRQQQAAAGQPTL